MEDSKCLLLLGRTGNGKSSTGNSILEKPAFKSRSPSASADHDVIMKDEAVVDELSVQVVDGTGIGDCNSDSQKDVMSLIMEITEKVLKWVLGFNAIVLVLQYGVRFTNQEKQAVEIIKSIFGQDILKKWGVIVMTHGDNFELDNEDRGATFEDWIKEQTGDIQTLFEECNNRCVLFNNRTKDKSKKRAQRHNLMEKVKAITSDPYTSEHFDKAEGGRRKLILKEQLPSLRSETDEVVRRVNEITRDIDTRMQWRPEECFNELRHLQNELNRHRIRLENIDQGSGLLKSLLTDVGVAELSVKTKMKMRQRSIDRQCEEQFKHSEEQSIFGNNEPLWKRLWNNESFKIVFSIFVVAVTIAVIAFLASLA